MFLTLFPFCLLELCSCFSYFVDTFTISSGLIPVNTHRGNRATNYCYFLVTTQNIKLGY